MTLIKKTIILSSQETQGYCTIVRVGSEIGAKIVGANFTSSMRVGIKIGAQKTYISILQGAKTEIDLPLSFSQNDNVGCLITSGDTVFAKGGIYISKDDMIIPVSIINTPSFKENVVENTNNIKIDLAASKNVKETAQHIDIPTSKSLDEDKTEVYTTNKELEDAVLDEDNDILKRLGGENTNFYATAKDKINELFVIYPPDKNLESMIPDSKWVKISYDGEDYYVVGQLLNEGKLNFIGYGVPGIKAIQPPKITDGYADWLPVNNIKPYDGYWLIFQNAENGKMSNL